MAFLGNMMKLTARCAVLSSVVILGACNMHMPTQVTSKKMQYDKSSFSDEVLIKDADDAYIASLASSYRNRGEGPVNMIVAYDPASRVNTAMNASHHASRLVHALEREGVASVQTNIIPVHNLGEDSKALISFVAYRALPPEDCSSMPRFNGGDVEVPADYQLGCTTQTAFARQISRPKDLASSAQPSGLTDGRRASNIVDRYRSGTPNRALEGESATGR